MNEFAIWYLLLTTIPNSNITYNRPIGPFTEQQCIRAKNAVIKMEWYDIASAQCKKAIGFKLCEFNPGMSETCPVF